MFRPPPPCHPVQRLVFALVIISEERKAPQRHLLLVATWQPDNLDFFLESKCEAMMLKHLVWDAFGFGWFFSKFDLLGLWPPPNTGDFLSVPLVFCQRANQTRAMFGFLIRRARDPRRRISASTNLGPASKSPIYGTTFPATRPLPTHENTQRQVKIYIVSVPLYTNSLHFFLNFLQKIYAPNKYRP